MRDIDLAAQTPGLLPHQKGVVEADPRIKRAATMNLRQALHAASVRRVIVLRHGNTHKADVDADRQLTDKGNRQCDLFREHYADRLSLVHSRRHSRHSHGHHRHRHHR